MPIAFLLALQASGMVVDWLGKNEQIRMGKMGQQIEQAGITANIQQTRLEAEDESLQSMKQLRQNLGTQAAMMAAKGIRAGTPTSAIFATESVGNFNADNKIRKINQMGREAELKAGGLLSSLHQETSARNVWNQFRSSAASKIPTSPSSYKAMGTSFGLTTVGS